MLSKLTLTFLAAVTTASIGSAAFAESSYGRDGAGKGPQVGRQYVAPTPRKNGRSAYGLTAGPSSQSDRYSPALNGGGSYGYNEKLLQGGF
jgi:hypothetical protein